MTREDIIRMAQEAGLDLYINDVTEEPYVTKLEVFAALVAACARVADVADENKCEWIGGVES
jgi:hypothetical protein